MKMFAALAAFLLSFYLSGLAHAAPEGLSDSYSLDFGGQTFSMLWDDDNQCYSVIQDRNDSYTYTQAWLYQVDTATWYFELFAGNTKSSIDYVYYFTGTPGSFLNYYKDYDISFGINDSPFLLSDLSTIGLSSQIFDGTQDSGSFPIPEPAAVTTLAVGAMALITRVRRLR